MRGEPRAILLMLLGAAPLIAASPNPAPLELRYATGTFRPHSSPPRAPAWYKDSSEKDSPRGQRYLVAIGVASLEPDQRRQIEAAGATILGYVPAHGYRLRIDPARVDALRSLPFIAWLGEPPAHLKVSAELSLRAEHPGSPVRVRVILEA
ncbi:MAG: hypothetical protein L0170_13770, partial [Acidobacteria bacterium]|nr:hypothetical protein [Acidobacteriota bacterium]